MDLSQWLVDEIDDITALLRTQVLELVPPARRDERPGGGSPILWNTLHAARHASLALAVLSPEWWPERSAWMDALVSKAGPGIGVEEAAPPWADELSPGQVDGYLDDVLAGARPHRQPHRRDDRHEEPDGAEPVLTAAAEREPAPGRWLAVSRPARACG